MKSSNHVIGIPVISSVSYEADQDLSGKHPSSVLSSYVQSSTSYGSSSFKHEKGSSVLDKMSKLSRKANTYTQGIREHVSLGPKLSETVKGKLSMGTRILRAGGVERVFRRNFSVSEGEKLLKAFQCYLSTTAGPIAGLLFVSTEKVAFHSDRYIRISSAKGNLARVPYKVLIPLKRIKGANQTENATNPNQKYMQILTEDDFEFWFMGFVNYERSFRYLQQAITKSEASFSQCVEQQ